MNTTSGRCEPNFIANGTANTLNRKSIKEIASQYYNISYDEWRSLRDAALKRLEEKLK